jgi:hypothetical protein
MKDKPMKLLRENVELRLNEEKLNELRELNSQGKPITVVALLTTFDKVNGNKRIYPYETTKKDFQRYLEEVVRQGNALGELDHNDEAEVAVTNVSHVIDDVWWKDDGPEKQLFGKIRLLNTPRGNIAKELVLSGIPLGISSRAVGSTEKDYAKDADVVQSDFHLITYDLVATPSNPGSFLKISESKIIKNFDPSKVLPAGIRIKETLKELLGK